MEPEALIRQAAAILYPEDRPGVVAAGGRVAGVPEHDAVTELPDEARILIFAGPGVMAGDAVSAVRALATKANIGVANSWGAKGLFEWQSPYHLGTVGLQERDFALCGFGACDLILATGIDPEETPPHRWALAPVMEVAPFRFATIRVKPRAQRIQRPPLYERLAALVMPQYDSDRQPPPPGRRIAELKARLAPADRVAADAATLAGFWVARAFPTTHLGSVIVPARAMPGFAAAAAVAGALRGCRVVGVTMGPMDEATAAVLEFAARRGVAVELEVWGEGGLAVDWSSTAEIVEIAGPIIAWGGIDLP